MIKLLKLVFWSIATIIALFVLIVVFVPSPAQPPQVASGAPTVEATISPTSTVAWYSGGTLHHATVAQWIAATDTNRLATAADWATAGMALTRPSEIERYAKLLQDCVNDAATGYPSDNEALDIATVCVVMIKAQAQ